MINKKYEKILLMVLSNPKEGYAMWEALKRADKRAYSHYLSSRVLSKNGISSQDYSTRWREALNPVQK